MIRLVKLSLMILVAISMSVGALAQVATPAPEGQTTIVGNAIPLLPDGEPGAVEVIAYSVPVEPRDSIGWIVKNNTDQSISEIVITADLHTPDGKLLGVTNRSSIATEQLNPGEIAIGYSSGANIADPSVQISFHISYDIGPPSHRWSETVEIVAAEQNDDRIIGEFTNTSEVTLDGVFFYYACFDETGKLLGVDLGSFDGKFAPLERRAFQVMGDIEGCAYFLVSGQGSID